MSNRKLSLLERKERRLMRRKCPKCGTTNVKTTEYPDAYLHICQNEQCRFPVREVKPDGQGGDRTPGAAVRR